MKVLRKTHPTWAETIEARAKAVGYDEADRNDIAEHFAGFIIDRFDYIAISEDDAAWEVARHWDMLQTIRCAQPGPDLAEAA